MLLRYYKRYILVFIPTQELDNFNVNRVSGLNPHRNEMAAQEDISSSSFLWSKTLQVISSFNKRSTFYNKVNISSLRDDLEQILFIMYLVVYLPVFSHSFVLTQVLTQVYCEIKFFTICYQPGSQPHLKYLKLLPRLLSWGKTAWNLILSGLLKTRSRRLHILKGRTLEFRLPSREDPENKTLDN